MTYRFELLFNSPREGDPPFTPTWHIYATHGGQNRLGFHAVTPTDCTETEIDAEIDKLIAELEILRKRIKNKYKAWSKK